MLCLAPGGQLAEGTSNSFIVLVREAGYLQDPKNSHPGCWVAQPALALGGGIPLLLGAVGTAKTSQAGMRTLGGEMGTLLGHPVAPDSEAAMIATLKYGWGASKSL